LLALLPSRPPAHLPLHSFPTRRSSDLPQRVVAAAVEGASRHSAKIADPGNGHVDQPVEELPHARAPQGDHAADWLALAQLEVGRSEEHTSELSHRTISYAVFCLKKKKK